MKQGMTTQDADSLITEANKSSNNASFDVRLTVKFLKEHVRVDHVHVQLLHTVLIYSVLEYCLSHFKHMQYL